MYKQRNKLESKFIEKLLKYKLMFKDILSFLCLDYKDASLLTLYFAVLGISIQKIRSIEYLYHLKICA